MFFIRSDGKKRISSRRRVSVPSSGDVFYLHLETYSEVEKKHCFRPLFWGCFLFQLMKWAKKAWTKSGFRPLFRGCFLFVYNDRPHDNGGNKRVSVPSFGDIFYSFAYLENSPYETLIMFPSPLSRMFFIQCSRQIGYHRRSKVSVPSFGDVFYSRTARVACASGDMQFPSPLSGMFFINNEWINRRSGLCSTVSVPSFEDVFYFP